MFAYERYRKIKEILQEYNHIDVITLSSLLDVSQVTIRKDLEKLEADGVLTRIHGGALLNQELSENISASDADILQDEKKNIGKLAAQLVQRDDIIFLGNGNTCLQIAKNLKAVPNLSVITNNISVMQELFGLDNINLIVAGGKVQKSSSSYYFYGSLTIEVISKLHFHKAFLSPTGVHIKYGYSTANPELLDLYNAIKQVADERIIVADYTKFNKISMIQFASLSDIQTIVSNENIPGQYKDYYFSSGIKLYTTINSEIQETV